MPAADREKWDAKYRAEDDAPRAASAVLRGLRPWLPQGGRALEVAGGAGRNAIWLAQQGFDVTVADVSPVGLALAQSRAAAAGVRLRTLEVDLETSPLPAGPWDLIVSVCYLWRPLFAAYSNALAEGGALAVVQPTTRNLERHAKPPAAYLLDEGELPRLVAGLEIVHWQEGWLADDRHDAVLVARRPPRATAEAI